MSHKITLTGNPCSDLKKFDSILAFDLETGGSDSPPKGLPSSKNAIKYTVFCNQKQLRKAGLLEGDIKEHKLLVQGEPVLDLPLNKCTGRIGVTCFKVEKIEKKAEEKPEEVTSVTSSAEEVKIDPIENSKQEKAKELPEEAPPVKSIKIEEKEVKEPVKEEIIKKKETTVKIEINQIPENFPLSKIIISEQFLNTPPRREKVNEAIDFYNKNNKFDKPVVVKKKNLTLVDGYKRYVAAKELGLSEILVKFI
ncbi:MAG: ParB N-terminal domain-containing protein [Candidatus Eremiobacterota bacterium]